MDVDIVLLLVFIVLCFETCFSKRFARYTEVENARGLISLLPSLNEAPSTSFEDCATLCMNTETCYSFFYDNNGGMCRLTAGQLTVSQMVVSASPTIVYYTSDVKATENSVLTPLNKEVLVPDRYWYTFDVTTNCALKIYFGISLTFDSANDYCGGIGYRLAYFKTPHAYQYFNDFADLHAEVSAGGWYYIGAKKNTSVTYQWLDGTPLAYVEWAPLQPNHYGPNLGLWNGGSGRFEADDYHIPNRFICETCF